MTKLEEVARVLLVSRQRRGLSGAADWEHEPTYVKEIYLDSARAAIEVLRNPTDAIRNVMNKHAYNSMVDWDDLHCAMIDAILDEKL